MRDNERTMMPTLAKEKSVASFDETNLGYNMEDALRESQRCYNCKNPTCKIGCPIGNNIPEFIAAIKEKNFEKSFKEIEKIHFMPSVCGRVCHQQAQCEGSCIRSRKDKAVAIGALERFVGDYFYKHFYPSYFNDLKAGAKQNRLRNGNIKIAVIGSGPASLSAAQALLCRGFSVSIFEAQGRAGGKLNSGIPAYRLPEAVAERAISEVKELGAQFIFNTTLGRNIFLNQLLEQHNAVFIGCGVGAPLKLQIEGEDLNNVCPAEEFLLNKPRVDGKAVLVFGGGNVAIDGARTARRLGASKVKIVYRRTLADMPASREEVYLAKNEGVEFLELVAPIRFEGENSNITGAICQRLIQSSARGQLLPTDEASVRLECDMALIAIGSASNNLNISNLALDDRGRIAIDERMQTNIENVFAGGDAVAGAATVVLALKHGRTAAHEIAARFENK